MPAHNAKDITGQRFGRLIALRRGPTQGKKATWICCCDCGTECLTQYWSLVAGYTRSCGCYRRELVKLGRNHKHDMKGSPEYAIWRGMKQRCYNPKSAGYPSYGGRGIIVCDRWRNDFMAFYSDMGPRPSPGHSVERKDNDGPYSPDNCIWATRSEQQSNKRNSKLIEAFGKRQTASAWARETGIRRNLIFMRVIKYGWPAERALTTPVRQGFYPASHG
jgi:hypothetical protein